MFTRRAALLTSLAQTLSRHQVLSNPLEVLTYLAQKLLFLENSLRISLDDSAWSGILLHLVMSLFSEKQKGIYIRREAREYIDRNFSPELLLCFQAIWETNQCLSSTLPDEEAYNILGIFKKLDIFIDTDKYKSMVR
jgi:PRD domain